MNMLMCLAVVVHLQCFEAAGCTSERVLQLKYTTPAILYFVTGVQFAARGQHQLENS